MSAAANAVNDERKPMAHWAWLVPAIARALLGWTLAAPPGPLIAARCLVALMA